MNPYNKTQTDAVWRRVLSPGREAAARDVIQESGQKIPKKAQQGSSREIAWQETFVEKPQDRLPPLLLLTRELTCHYEVLARRSPRFRPLCQEVQRQTACLTGLHRVLTGTPAPEIPRLPEPKGQTVSLLSRCCRLEGELARLQAEAGEASLLRPALEELAAETRRRCCACLEALGRAGR